jgi:hypothetical protein
MNFDHYNDVKFAKDYQVFLFLSEGPKGSLTKVVIYSPIKGLPGGYNLGLGTLKTNEDGEEYVDVNEISDNGDRDKILATVALTAFTFTDHYPERKIYLSGTNKIRTRLYQMAINNAYLELSDEFLIFGDTSKDPNVYRWQNFTKGINYTGFLVARRKL